MQNIQIVPVGNRTDVGAAAAEQVADLIRHKPNATLVFPTGDTPLPMYRQLADACRRAPEDVFHLSLKGITTFNLDEYVGASYENSYDHFMWENFIRHTDMRLERAHIPHLIGRSKNMDIAIAHECAYYDSLLDQHLIDLAVLGVGQNGHIGFNEPGCDPEERTHLVTLSESTRAANAHLFRSPEDVPTQAITMGLKDILSAKRIILLASGSAKKEAILKLCLGKEDPDWPVTYLLRHPDVTLIVDNDCLPMELYAQGHSCFRVQFVTPNQENALCAKFTASTAKGDPYDQRHLSFGCESHV